MLSLNSKNLKFNYKMLKRNWEIFFLIQKQIWNIYWTRVIL